MIIVDLANQKEIEDILRICLLTYQMLNDLSH